ncbi:hypothetical protein YC2023_060429 [Brassica napus]
MYPIKKSLNPSHLRARNDLLSSDLKLAQLGPQNTSLGEYATMLPAVAQFDTGISAGSLEVPGPRLESPFNNIWFPPAPSLNLKASLYILWSLLVSGLNCKACLYNNNTSSSRAQHLSAELTALISYISRGVKTRNAFEYSSSSVRVVRRKEPCPSTGNTAAPPPKKTEKMLTLHQGILASISSTHLKQCVA